MTKGSIQKTEMKARQGILYQIITCFYAWLLPLETQCWPFSELGDLGGSIRERFSRKGQSKAALTCPSFSWLLLENDRL